MQVSNEKKVISASLAIAPRRDAFTMTAPAQNVTHDGRAYVGDDNATQESL